MGAPKCMVTGLFPPPKQTSLLSLHVPLIPESQSPMECLKIWGSGQLLLLLTIWVQRSHIPAVMVCLEAPHILPVEEVASP